MILIRMLVPLIMLMILYGTFSEMRRRMKTGMLDIYLVLIIIFTGYDYGTDTIFITILLMSTLPNRFLAEYFEIDDYIETLELRTIHKVVQELLCIDLKHEVSEEAYCKSKEAHLNIQIQDRGKRKQGAGVKVHDDEFLTVNHMLSKECKQVTINDTEYDIVHVESYLPKDGDDGINKITVDRRIRGARAAQYGVPKPGGTGLMRSRRGS